MKNLTKYNTKTTLLLSCLFLFLGNRSAEAQDIGDSTEKYAIAINAFYWQNKSITKTLMLGSSVYRNTRRDWLKLYAASNYFEQSSLESFGGLNSSLGIEAGAGFKLRMGRRFSSTILTGIGYHRVHVLTLGITVRHNTIAAFGSLDFSYSYSKYELGVILGSSMGTGSATTFYADGNIDSEILFSFIPKLGLQFKINL